MTTPRFRYRIPTGLMTLTEVPDWHAWGHAGQGEGFDNAAMQAVIRTGPLPVGFYTIGKPYTHERLGPVTMNLEPFPENQMYERAAFRIHGFSSTHPELSSQGCIALHKVDRLYIADKRIHVAKVLEVYV